MEDNIFRIPISLKVEKDDMYYNFIKPARDDRSLTKIIMSLLRAYYEDDEIRRLVDARNAGEDVLRILNEEIDRIALEHSKSIAQVSALKFETESMRDDIPKATVNNIPRETPSTTMESIMSMLANLTNQVSKLESRVDKAGLPMLMEDDTDSNIDIPDFDAEMAAYYADKSQVFAEEHSDMDFSEMQTSFVEEDDDSAIFEAIEREEAEKARKAVEQAATTVVPKGKRTSTKAKPASVVEEKPAPAVEAEAEIASVFEDDDFTIPDDIEEEVASPEVIKSSGTKLEEPKVSKGVPSSFMKLSSSLLKTAK